jgi:uncharacterized protein (DUF1778 family)
LNRRVGRPRLSDEAATEIVSVRLTRATKRTLGELALINQTTITAFIREAIEEAAADCVERRVFQPRADA